LYRSVFDEWLRERARQKGAFRRQGSFDKLEEQGEYTKIYFRVRAKGEIGEGQMQSVLAKAVIWRRWC
jgi:hypothetical protein